MTDDFLKLRIVRIHSETSDTRSYYLESLDGRQVQHRAGQFLTLILQHHTGGSNVHEVRRSYSLSSATDEPLRLTIKRIQNGEISRYLHDTLMVGDVLTSLPPAGRFTVDENLPGDLVLLGAGSGITPLLAITKQVLRTEPERRVTLLYSNSSERTIIFREELNDLQRQFPDRFRLLYLLSNPSEDWSGLRGRLNNVMLERLIPDLVGGSDPQTLHFYVCGPGDYMRMVQFTLVFSGFRPDQIRRENFVVEPVVLSPPPLLAQDRTVMIQYRGQQVEIQVPAYKSILQAALDDGIALPYSCRGGRCSTCVARCLSGSVHMTINDVLTERDLRQGWVLTCTGYPESDDVVLDV
ncbi:ferredoxin--NADP reductase [Spirosoma endbachense]|uniref:2Fe-2S iron-sulfur cluster binding domain-containing protein n=1 Tax=Spirosoma endbachense TaxID=2666025 RepID=A0A6P1VZR9_9BACT|nr:ferredoxin--NADP reductase [Spirosoma endbachense]QHV98134.1 2Fe-2S iron-sulfur cluster binding domain-containing protein [Spirosoma endbachense]